MIKNIIYGVCALAAFSVSQATLADSDYYSNILVNAKSAKFYLSIADDKMCKVDDRVGQSFLDLTKLINDKGSLRVIQIPTPDNIPDLGVMYSIDTAPSSVSKDYCNFAIRLEVFHSTRGYLRYDTEDKVLRILAYKTFMYGSVARDELSKEITKGIDLLTVEFLKQLKSAKDGKSIRSY